MKRDRKKDRAGGSKGTSKAGNVYRSIEEFESKLLPKYHQEKIAEKRRKEPRLYGTGHAAEILEKIKDQVAKSH